MKREPWLSSLLGIGLGVCMAVGAMGCLASAFELNIEYPSRLLLIWTAGSALCALLWRWRWGDLPVLLAVGLGMGYLLRRGELVEQLRQLIYRITYIYDQAYHWGLVSWPGMTWDGGAADLPVLVMGMLLAAAVCRSVCRGGSPAVSVMLAVLPLASCLVVTDTVPSWEGLFLLLFAAGVLLLTGTLRQEDPEQANRLTLMGAVPVAAVLVLLFAVAPQERYVNRTEDIRQSLQNWLQSFSRELEAGTGEALLELEAPTPEQMDLSGLGSRNPSREPVLYVTAQTGGSVYLRGMDYDQYTGTGWASTGSRAETFACEGQDLGYVSVETVRQFDRLYLPYYPAEGYMLVGGQEENTALYTQYTFRRMGLPENFGTLLVEGSAEHTPDPQYLQLPQQTLEKAQTWVQGMEEEQTASGKAQRVAALVRQAAVYTLDAQRMPSDAEDFALWFLEEAGEGYCVHFATAAVVLLRAAGVEARYVTGYLVKAQAGQTMTATGENAHAWAEYYEPLLGAWLVLEATPGDVGAAELRPTEETTTPETQPLQTQEETEASQETEPDETAPAAEKESGFAMWKVLLALALTWLLAEVQRKLRVIFRRSWMRRGDANRQALKRWQQVGLVARLLGEKPPEPLRELAQKAAYSQHTLTAADLLEMDAYLRTGCRRLSRQPWYRQLLYRYGYALY